MATITQRESEQIERANATGRTPVVFIHGLWLLPSSWDRWAAALRGGRLRAAGAGLARRPRDGRAGARQPRSLRRQGRRRGRRPLRRGDRQARPQAGGHRPLLRRPDRADPRRAGTLGRNRRGRPRSLQRGAAAADRGDPHDPAGARQPCTTAAAPSPSASISSATAGPTRSARMRRGESTRSSTSPRRAGRSSRRRSPTSTPAPRPRPTPRTPSVGRC